MNLKFMDVAVDNLYFAVVCCRSYKEKYPDKPLGIRHGVSYYDELGNRYMYVYKTKTSIVVRGEAKKEF